jgi:2-methylcitrate dehydratase PrpD
MTESHTAARTLAQFVCALTADALPVVVVDRARYLLFDHLGVALAGMRTETAASVLAAVTDLGAGGDALILGHTRTANAPAAALVNGTAAHCLEMDDTHQAGSIHLGASVFPTALACAAMAPTSGARFLTAAVIGYEVAARIAMALGPKAHYARGFHPTGTCGAFGAAAVAASLLQLDVQQATWALGIAGSQAAGSMEFLAGGAWTKRMHPGWAAAAGLHAAALARHGLRGPDTIFEGRDGFLDGHSARPDVTLLTADLGRAFEILQTSIKPHACCRYKQAPIDALLELRRTHGLHPEDIDQITIGMLEAGIPIVCEPRDRKIAPVSIVDAQFSLPFGAAVALVHGRASPREYSEDGLRDPLVRALMPRVRYVGDRELETAFPRHWPAWVRVRVRDGTEYHCHVAHPHGDPDHPLSWDDLETKIRDLLDGIVGTESIAMLRTAVSTLDRAPTLAPLLAALRAQATDPR